MRGRLCGGLLCTVCTLFLGFVYLIIKVIVKWFIYLLAYFLFYSLSCLVYYFII